MPSVCWRCSRSHAYYLVHVEGQSQRNRCIGGCFLAYPKERGDFWRSPGIAYAIIFIETMSSTAIPTGFGEYTGVKTTPLLGQHTSGMPAPETEKQEPALPPPRAQPRRLLNRLLAMPLFYKVLIANSVIVVLGALAGTTITLNLAQSRPQEGI